MPGWDLRRRQEKLTLRQQELHGGTLFEAEAQTLTEGEGPAWLASLTSQTRLCSVPWARLAPGAAALGEGARPEGMEGSGESSSRDSVRAEQQLSLRQQNGGAPWWRRRLLRRAVTTAAFITHHQTAISSPASSLITQPAFSSRFITGINNEFRAWKAIKMCD